MAGYNEILVGRYNRYLQKLLGMKGSPPARSLGGDILTVLPLFHGNENLYLQGWDYFIQALNIGGTAGNISQGQIRNPPGSNVVGVVMKMSFSLTAAAATAIVLGLSIPPQAGLATPAVPTNQDSRGRPSSTLGVSSQSAVGGVAGSAMGFVSIATGTVGYTDMIVTDSQELPMLPGTSIQIGPNSVNTGINIIFWWRERFLEDSERT